jgi:hypothetical protein
MAMEASKNPTKLDMASVDPFAYHHPQGRRQAAFSNPEVRERAVSPTGSERGRSPM